MAQIAEFLHLDRGIHSAVQTAAISALDGMGRYRSKIQELLTAVNAGVNHGILMSLVRKTVTDISSPESTLPNSFVEALISFVTFIASHASGGNMIVGAGLIPLLIQLIENKVSSRLSIVSKAMQLVDNVVYGFPNAFQLFCNARGIDAVVQRIEVSSHSIFEAARPDSVLARSKFGCRGEWRQWCVILNFIGRFVCLSAFRPIILFASQHLEAYSSNFASHDADFWNFRRAPWSHRFVSHQEYQRHH